MKIDIISGFLGAGKTTLIKKFISEAFQGEKVVLIENEFGEIGVDAGFLTDAGIEIKEMNSGCICCSLVGDFSEALKEVIETYLPERIIIEPSGVGKLSDVEKAVLDTGVSLNNKIVVVNAKKCSMYAKNFGEFFVNQVENADAIVCSRTSDMSTEQLEETIELLCKYNKKGTKITTPWEQLDGKDIINTIENQHQLEESLLEELNQHKHHEHHGDKCGCGGGCGCGDGCGCNGHHHGHHHHEHHHASDVFKSWGIETAIKYQQDMLTKLLEDLENESKYGAVLRAKGMLECENNKWIYFDYVPGEVEVREGRPCTIGKICVIGSNINEENLKKIFE
ncbi:MAG: GTP-binding protein [Eubacteriales bacterium]